MAIRPAEQIIHKAAWLYYAHGLRQDEVASQLNISRASVAMYLRKARETGIVNISTSTPAVHRRRDGARDRGRAWASTRVWIVAGGRAALDPSTEIAAAGGERLSRAGQEGRPHRRRLGPHRLHIADVMSYADLQDVTVVQLCGNLGAPYSYRPDQCTMEIARRLNAKGLNFYAPLVLSTEELATALRDEPVIREQLAGDLATATSRSIRSARVDADSHLVKCGALTAAEMAGAAPRRAPPASSPARSSTPRARCSTAATTGAASRPTWPRCAPSTSA